MVRPPLEPVDPSLGLIDRRPVIRAGLRPRLAGVPDWLLAERVPKGNEWGLRWVYLRGVGLRPPEARDESIQVLGVAEDGSDHPPGRPRATLRGLGVRDGQTVRDVGEVVELDLRPGLLRVDGFGSGKLARDVLDRAVVA